MLPVFANLPDEVSIAISEILSRPQNADWMKSAEKLHDRYTKRLDEYFYTPSDVFAYLGMRTAATYAQIYSALSQIKQLCPTFAPNTLLDLGCGPGTGLWAGKTLFPSIIHATCIDQNKNFLTIGQEICKQTSFAAHTSWQCTDLTKNLGNIRNTYDLIIIANVLNELTITQREYLINQAYSRCHGILVVIEPGTPFGFTIMQQTARKLSSTATIIAPYINNSFVESQDYWIHFSQRFIRPEFQRKIRKYMREDNLSASDWEDTKYCYVAIGDKQKQQNIWGRSIGQITKQKGFLTIPILTEKEIIQVKVMKRYKEQYIKAKKMHWGDIIKQESDIVVKPSALK